ncbi:MAG: transposase [Bacteroidota bacterium]
MEIIEYYPEFFTATILEWKHLLKQDTYKDIIVNSLEFLVQQKRIVVYGFVLMNNHIHIIWQVQANNKPKEIQLSFMKYTAQMIIKDLRNNHQQVLVHFRVDNKDRKHQIWERNPLNIELRSREVLEQKLNYIHQNPVKANLCLLPEEYVFSSAAYYYCIDKNKWNFITHYNQ